MLNNIDTSSLELTIPFLSIDRTYLFQVCTLILSSIHSSYFLLKIRSMIISKGDQILMSLPIKIHFNYQEEFFSIKNFQISKPYFINGLIKANISWNKITDYRIKQYDIYWIETQCHSEILSCCYRRDAVTIQNYFQLYDLRFNCTYLVNIKIIGLNQIQSFPFYFNVSSCQLTEVYGTIQPPCQTDRKTSTNFSFIESIIYFFLKLTPFHRYRQLILLLQVIDQVLICFGKMCIHPVRQFSRLFIN
jgi:hypothetical protein